MFNDSNLYIQQFQDIIRGSVAQISTIKPSEWTEQNVIMGKPRPGPFRYDYTPYAREIIDCLAPDHPVRKLAVIKGAQIGFSSGVIVPGIGWMIQNNPGNTYLMVGAADLVSKAMDRVDLMIDGAQLQDYIRSQSARRANKKSGDTNEKKEFAGGYLVVGSANNHKAIAQVDLQYIFLDDLDAMKGTSASSGDLIKLIEKRAAAYKDSYKMFLISTPLTKQASLIEPAYLLGDRRHYFVECQCCHEPIIIKWSVAEGEDINPLQDEKATCPGGIVFERDHHGRVIEKSVGYTCYKCGGFFTDRNKYEMLNGGIWVPTAESSRPDYRSYKIPSLYAPIGMFDWLQCARDYAQAHPIDQPRIESEYQVFLNTVLGETYEPDASELSAKGIMKNTRSYKPGIVPEKQSIADGNGRIILLTCAADLNGDVGANTGKDARLDYEIVAHAESGATYSVFHGSIGTWQRGEAGKVERQKWSCMDNADNCIWPEFDRIISTPLEGDDGLLRKIAKTGVDTGFCTKDVYAYLDRRRSPDIIGVRGKKEYQRLKIDNNESKFEPGRVRKDEYFLQVGFYKDDLSNYMQLTWQHGQKQPANFMNFPQPTDGLYLYDNYFEHYEAEHRAFVPNKDGSTTFKWEKKRSDVKNHMFDCRVYNIALRDIVVSFAFEYLKQTEGYKGKVFTWADYVQYALSLIG